MHRIEQAPHDLKRAGAVRDMCVQVIGARGSYAPPLFKEEMDGNLNQIVTFTLNANAEEATSFSRLGGEAQVFEFRSGR